MITLEVMLVRPKNWTRQRIYEVLPISDPFSSWFIVPNVTFRYRPHTLHVTPSDPLLVPTPIHAPPSGLPCWTSFLHFGHWSCALSLSFNVSSLSSLSSPNTSSCPPVPPRSCFKQSISLPITYRHKHGLAKFYFLVYLLWV
jgi:hypothetical protein